jgi:putative Flp pilus-assembly TadE/G-like protein
MHNLLRCRRGSAAFATVAALVPLIGFVALGGEAGSWYVTKQHAQNAADAAAISGALRLACSISGSSTCDAAHDYVYRGKQFAAQNAFCNAGDSSYPGSNCASLPTGTSQTVQIDQPTPTRVRAIVSQQQPAYLAAVLGLSTVNIGAQAIAEVQNPKNLCVLGLGRWPSSQSALTIGGSSNITGNGCGMMSNDTVKYASTPSFDGSGWGVYGANGCVNSGNCDPGVPYNYYMPPATNPLQGLDTDASLNTRTGSTKPCSGNCGTVTLNPNGTGAYGGLTVTTGDNVTFSPGTYFFYNAAIKINGGTVTGTNVTIVLLGDSSLSISGGTVNLSAPTNNATYPQLSGVLIDDQAPNKSKNAVTVNGSGSTVTLGGTMYFPNVDVTWSGTSQNANTTCSQVIANSLTMTGNAYMSTQGCTPGTIAYTQVVVLVQ